MMQDVILSAVPVTQTSPAASGQTFTQSSSSGAPGLFGDVLQQAILGVQMPIPFVEALSQEASPLPEAAPEKKETPAEGMAIALFAAVMPWIDLRVAPVDSTATKSLTEVGQNTAVQGAAPVALLAPGLSQTAWPVAPPASPEAAASEPVASKRALPELALELPAVTSEPIPAPAQADMALHMAPAARPSNLPDRPVAVIAHEQGPVDSRTIAQPHAAPQSAGTKPNPPLITPERPPEPPTQPLPQTHVTVQVTQEQSAPPLSEGESTSKQEPISQPLVQRAITRYQSQSTRPTPALPATPAEALPKLEHEEHGLLPLQATTPPHTTVAAPKVEEVTAPMRGQVDPEAILRQAVRFVKVAADGHRSEMRFQLHPEHLGSLSVKLTFDGTNLRANLVAPDAAVKAVLESGFDQLRGRLAEQGLNVEQLQVSVGSQPQFGHAQGGSDQWQQERNSRPSVPFRQVDGQGAQEPLQSEPTPLIRQRGMGLNLNLLA